MNSKDRSNNVFKCEVKDIHNSIKKLINHIIDDQQSIVFSIVIDGTKVLQNLSINSGRKCIIGRTYLNHIINTTHLSKQCIVDIIGNKQKSIPLTQEVKVATICAQNMKKGVSHMAVIATKP